YGGAQYLGEGHTGSSWKSAWLGLVDGCGRGPWSVRRSGLPVHSTTSSCSRGRGTALAVRGGFGAPRVPRCVKPHVRSVYGAVYPRVGGVGYSAGHRLEPLLAPRARTGAEATDGSAHVPQTSHRLGAPPAWIGGGGRGVLLRAAPLPAERARLDPRRARGVPHRPASGALHGPPAA